ncbi:cysteine--tRNA ligase [Candidatus Uhrbacteria bacterium RIFCSPLOWO2_12_FULL_46_10]|nr:MAG: cysteine--tRNA ligase [Candidatus Uhrbacteria bacterium RIFCSPLOWO2_12_FULL_46_10]
MPLKLFNTMSRKKEIFKPLKDKLVRMYSCGPTVYNYAHIGNLRTYIFSDALKRILMFNGYRVKHIMNITDVGHLTSEATDSGEDKLEVGAAREGKSVFEIRDFYIKAFRRDLAALNILPPTKYTKATDNIKEQIALIKQLFRKRFAYDTPEVIYFDTAQLKDYGKLARLKVKGLKAGARVPFDVKKRNSTDFALWFKIAGRHKNHILRWPSPWGEGFPGWHIECSAMARKYLGQPLDIHTGAVDHISIHHTNEIAQSEAAYGKPLSHFWLHGEFLVLGKPGKEVRMGKSLGNFATLNQIVEMGIDPLAYRYLCLTAHYRAKLYFDMRNLMAAARGLLRLREAIGSLPASVGHPIAPVEKKFRSAINDDLNMPRALAIAWDCLKSKRYDGGEKKSTLLYFDTVFGLGLDQPVKKADIPTEIKRLVEEREQARRVRNWLMADKLRKTIQERGYVLEDTPNGPQVKRASQLIERVV